MFDFHVHTHHSFDGSHPSRELVERAIQLGMTHLCLTDHVDYDYDGKGSVFSFCYQAFFNEITRAKQHYGSQIHLLAGVEFGLQPHLRQEYMADADQWPFDYIIGSLHSVDKTDLLTGPYFETRNQQQAYLDYFGDMLQVVQGDFPFNTLGHFDVVKRYGSFPFPLPLNDFQDIATTIFKHLIPQGKGIEVNTSGYRYGLGDAHPSRDILKLYRECGGEIVVLGSDAHATTDIGCKLKHVLMDLHHIGYHYVTTFKNRQPSFHKIERLL